MPKVLESSTINFGIEIGDSFFIFHSFILPFSNITKKKYYFFFPFVSEVQKVSSLGVSRKVAEWEVWMKLRKEANKLLKNPIKNIYSNAITTPLKSH